MEDIEKLRDGNLYVFGEIFQKYHSPLYRYVYNRTQSEYHADEVVQLTFIKLWKYRERLSVNYPLSTQIFRIAQSVLIDELRKLQTKSKAKYAYLTSYSKTASENEGSQHLEYLEMEKKLNTVIDNMPPIRRKVFKLSRLDCFSSKEISNKLSISPKTVDNHIYLALKQIKSLFSINLWLFFAALFLK